MRNIKVVGIRVIALLLLAGIAVVTGCDLEEDSAPVISANSVSALSLSKSQLDFLLDQNSDLTDAALLQTIELKSNNGSLVKWAIVTETPWLFISQTEGQTSGELDKVDVGINMDPLTPGLYRGSITVVEQSDTMSYIQKLAVTVRICEGVCIYVNTVSPSHKVTSLMFGSQSEFLNSGTSIWDSIVTTDCNDPDIPVGIPHAEQLYEFQQLGIGFLRYPSGIPSDFFHWEEAIGPINSRIPQINPWDSTYTDVKKECPVFGPDEFAEYADLLNARMLITTNVGSGTADEGARWLRYYNDRGVYPEYWEVGNEIYIEGDDYIFDAYMQPQEYAAAYDEHAKALRQVNPDIKIGAVMSPMNQAWNQGVMAAIKEPFDYISLHSFQPQIDTCKQPSDELVYQTLMASPLLMETQLRFIRDTARDLAVLPNKSPTFSVTEWGPWFLLTCEAGEVINNDARGRTMASALFSGLVWNSMMRDPSIFSAFHSALSSFSAQATLNIVRRDDNWVPVRSAFYYIQKLYFDSAGGMILPTTTRNSPTFSAKLFDNTVNLPVLPVLDSVAVLSEDNSKLYVYIINRGLTESIDFELFIGDLPFTVNSIEADSVVASSYSDANTADNPNAVGIANVVLANSEELQLTLPAHTMMRVTFSLTNN